MSFSTRKWNNFLYEEMLIEGRLQDTMKKYSEIDPEIIKQLSSSDPSGKNAYLMWMTKAMKDSGAGVYDVPGLARERIFDIVPLVADFHKAKQRISQLNKQRKKDGKGLYPNDINQFKSLDQLENFIDDLGLSGSEEKRKEKEAALGGASILQDDEDFFIIRPETQEASCFFGKKTKWCISATRSQNYYDSYTNQGKAFYFILNKNLNDDSKYRKIALVYDKNGEFEEFFDVEDEGYSDQYELIRILFYNLIAPAIKQNPDYPLKDEFVDMIAGALLDGDSLEAFLGSDDPEEMNEEDVKLYEDIVRYLQGQGDLAYNIDPPMIGDTTLYNGEEAASEFIELAQDTWNLIANEAYQSTMDNPPGTFSSEELRQMVEDAGLEHIDVTYDEEDYGDGYAWRWEADVSVQLDDAPFDQLRYEVESPDGEKEITDDFEEAYSRYDDREMVRDLIQSAFDSAGMYIDEVTDDDRYTFYLRMTPDYDEDPREGLDGFTEFLNRMKRYDKNFEEAIEKTYNDLVDDGVAIDPRNALEDEGAGGRGNIKEMLSNLKHMRYDISQGKLDIYGKVVFNIPNMMRNFKEMQKFFPALPDGETVSISGGKSAEEEAAFERQKGYARQLEDALDDRFGRKPLTTDLLRDITDKLAAPIERTRDKRKQIEIPGLEDKPEMGTQQGRGAEEYGSIMKQQGVDFFRPNFMFKPELRFLDGIGVGQRDAAEVAIGDRKIEGAHGIGMMGFNKVPLKDLRAVRKSNPEVYYAYINGFKWLDDNWQEVSDFVGEWISSNIVPVAKQFETNPGFADLKDAEFAQRARDQRPKSGLRERGCGMKPKKKRRIRIKIK
jgi:hypothetical protein